MMSRSFSIVSSRRDFVSARPAVALKRIGVENVWAWKLDSIVGVRKVFLSLSFPKRLEPSRSGLGSRCPMRSRPVSQLTPKHSRD